MAAYPDCSRDAARAAASELLTKPNIQGAIEVGKKARSERTHITQDRVLMEIARLAFNDPRRAFDEAGNLLPVHEWPDDVAAAISSIKIKRVPDGDTMAEVAEVKFWDKNSALEKAGKHLGVFEKDNKQKSDVRVVLANTDIDL